MRYEKTAVFTIFLALVLALLFSTISLAAGSNLEAYPITTLQKACRCSPLTYEIIIKNTGSFTEIYDFSVNKFSKYTTAAKNPLVLDPGAIESVKLYQTLPCDQAGTINAELQVRSRTTNLVAGIPLQAQINTSCAGQPYTPSNKPVKLIILYLAGIIVLLLLIAAAIFAIKKMPRHKAEFIPKKEKKYKWESIFKKYEKPEYKPAKKYEEPPYESIKKTSTAPFLVTIAAGILLAIIYVVIQNFNADLVNKVLNPIKAYAYYIIIAIIVLIILFIVLRMQMGKEEKTTEEKEIKKATKTKEEKKLSKKETKEKIKRKKKEYYKEGFEEESAETKFPYKFVLILVLAAIAVAIIYNFRNDVLSALSSLKSLLPQQINDFISYIQQYIYFIIIGFFALAIVIFILNRMEKRTGEPTFEAESKIAAKTTQRKKAKTAKAKKK